MSCETMECPSCGEIEPLDEDYQLCDRCTRRLLMADPPPEEDEPDDQDATPLIEGDDPDEHIDGFSPLFRDEPQEGGC